MNARKELTEKSAELRRVVSERNTLRARLMQAERTARELSSAFRAEAQLRSEFVDTHAASSAALRARVSELEALLAAKSNTASEERGGLRRIRGIGPAFERALLGLGITTVAQIAELRPDEIARIAPQIKARADRIERDDWVGQAQRLIAESSAE
jgi:predicted flap endonuclease-1-like 5' DNA nuclease